MDYLRKEGNVAVAVTGREQEFADAKIAALHYRIWKRSTILLRLRLQT